jgi:hypothetical protein
VVNERGDNTPFESATAVKDGGFYGWPWYYIGANENPRHKGARPDLKSKVTVPDVLLQAHTAPLQIVFYDATTFLSPTREAHLWRCTGRGIVRNAAATRSCACCSTAPGSRPVKPRIS